jgi:hypothetical protein
MRRSRRSHAPRVPRLPREMWLISNDAALRLSIRGTRKPKAGGDPPADLPYERRRGDDGNGRSPQSGIAAPRPHAKGISMARRCGGACPRPVSRPDGLGGNSLGQRDQAG